MVRKVLRQVVPFLASFLTVAVVFGGVALWRRAEDQSWCRSAVAKPPAGFNEAPDADLAKAERAACVIQRHRQRSMFGSVWRTGGAEAAECGFDLARIQLITAKNSQAEGPLLAPFGITDPSTFDASGTEDADRFLHACLATRQQAR